MQPEETPDAVESTNVFTSASTQTATEPAVAPAVPGETGGATGAGETLAPVLIDPLQVKPDAPMLAEQPVVAVPQTEMPAVEVAPEQMEAAAPAQSSLVASLSEAPPIPPSSEVPMALPNSGPEPESEGGNRLFLVLGGVILFLAMLGAGVLAWQLFGQKPKVLPSPLLKTETIQVGPSITKAPITITPLRLATTESTLVTRVPNLAVSLTPEAPEPSPRAQFGWYTNTNSTNGFAYQTPNELVRGKDASDLRTPFLELQNGTYAQRLLVEVQTINGLSLQELVSRNGFGGGTPSVFTVEEKDGIMVLEKFKLANGEEVERPVIAIFEHKGKAIVFIPNNSMDSLARDWAREVLATLRFL